MGLHIWIATIICASATLTVDAAKIGPRLVNGDVATEGQFPWQVGVVSSKFSLLSYCGGAIISDQWVLTNAYCLNGAESVIILYDTLNLDDIENKVKVSSAFVIHEEFDMETLNNNIGLVFVDTPFTFTDTVAPIALAEDKLEPETEVTVIGWGTTGDDDTNDKFDVLRYISVSTIANKDCVAAYGSTIVNDGVVCTAPGSPVKSPCKGDGGDPAVVDGDSGPVVVALFGFLGPDGCESTDYPAGFTRTAFYRDWIHDITGI